MNGVLQDLDYDDFTAPPNPRLSTRALVAGVAVCAAALLLAAVIHTSGMRRYAPLARKHALSAGLEPELVLAMISTESGGNARAVSPKGAIGLMQILPSTAKEVARNNGIVLTSPNDLFDPDTNIRLGAAYMAGLLERYGNDLTLALGAYNAGPTRVRQWLAAHPQLDSRQLCMDVFFPETRAYVISVLQKRRALKSGNRSHE